MTSRTSSARALATGSDRRTELRHRLSGSAEGLLINEETKQPLSCDAIDVSRGGMGITTREPLKVGSRVTLIAGAAKISLDVVWTRPSSAQSGSTRCGLATTNESDNPEAVFFRIQSGNGDEGPAPSLINGNSVRATRIAVEGLISVNAKTFGDRGGYDLDVVNASRSGMLLQAPKGQKVPFSVGTLLELEIIAKGKRTGRPMTCMAKVVRFQETHGGRAFGIQLTEMPPQALEAWDAFLLELTSR